jgi:hypothetical protein
VFIAIQVLDLAGSWHTREFRLLKSDLCVSQTICLWTVLSVYRCDLSFMLWSGDKGRLRPVTCHEDMGKGGGGGRCSRAYSWTSCHMGVEGECHAPATLPSGKTHGTRCRGDQVGTRAFCMDTGKRKSLAPHGFEPRTVQLLESRYTGYAICVASSSYFHRDFA